MPTCGAGVDHFSVCLFTVPTCGAGVEHFSVCLFTMPTCGAGIEHFHDRFLLLEVLVEDDYGALPGEGQADAWGGGGSF